MKDIIYKAKTYSYRLGYDGKLRVNAFNSLPIKRFLLALKRLRKHVEKTPFMADDCNMTGNKYTHCSWGMCCDVEAVYPDKQDYIWPEEKRRIGGHVEPLEPGKKMLCPHDLRKVKTLNGCFYTCAYNKEFKTGRGNPSRKEALKRIDDRIKQIEVRLTK